MATRRPMSSHGFIDGAHAATAKLADDAICADALPNHVTLLRG